MVEGLQGKQPAARLLQDAIQAWLTPIAELVELHQELRDYSCDQPEPEIEVPGPGDVVVPLRVRHGGRELSFLSIMATFGTPLDVTVAELAIESFLPADAETGRLLRHAWPAIRAEGAGPVMTL